MWSNRLLTAVLARCPSYGGIRVITRQLAAINHIPIDINVSTNGRIKPRFEDIDLSNIPYRSSMTLQQTRSFGVSLPVFVSREPQTATSSRQQDGIELKGAVKSSQRERLKLAIREYGATVIVFHTCISLFTLGISYMAVSSGVDVIGLLSKVGVGQSVLESKMATGASTFVIAYAAHKVFAPARMATTLAATPLIVRYLRRIGLIKRPPPTKT